jgi:hypothetical protein
MPRKVAKVFDVEESVIEGGLYSIKVKDCKGRVVWYAAEKDMSLALKKLAAAGFRFVRETSMGLDYVQS